jgi:hypothetical protein
MLLHALARERFKKPADVKLLDGGKLRFEWSALHKGARLPTLNSFLDLADASDEKVRRFAARHGPLFYHSADRTETTEEWKHYSKLAACIQSEGLVLALRSSGRKTTQEQQEQWDMLCKWVGIPDRRIFGTRKWYVQRALDKWFAEDNCTVRTTWPGASLEVYARPNSVFGVIGLKLCEEIGDTHRRELCFECRHWFPIKRVLPPGKRRFCPKCGRRAAMKHIMRERRRRLRLK